VHQEINRPLRQGVAAQQGADDIPDLGVPFAPAENRIDAFGERPGPEGGHTQRPPQQIWRFSGEIMRYDPAEKEQRKNRGPNGYIVDHISSPGSRPASRTAFAFITPWATLRSMTSIPARSGRGHKPHCCDACRRAQTAGSSAAK